MTNVQPGTWNTDPSHFRRPARREFLYVGWLGGLGLTVGNMFRLQAANADESTQAAEPKAKSVIHIYLQGGFAHMDSFDPKPDAPIEYRGILDNIETSVPGVRFSSHMRETARRSRTWRQPQDLATPSCTAISPICRPSVRPSRPTGQR